MEDDHYVVEAERSPTVFLSLTEKARETILKMDLDDLNNKEGMMKLYAKFDKLFKVDVSSEFMKISLKKYLRGPEINMSDIQTEFDR